MVCVLCCVYALFIVDQTITLKASGKFEEFKECEFQFFVNLQNNVKVILNKRDVPPSFGIKKI